MCWCLVSGCLWVWVLLLLRVGVLCQSRHHPGGGDAALHVGANRAGILQGSVCEHVVCASQQTQQA